MTTLFLHNLFLQCSGVSTDTRKIAPHCLFVALKGERFDANTFAQEALEKGASYVIIDNPQYHIDDRTVLVPDSLVALQELAQFHRDYLGLPIVALTGSNGKTTTKELINVVLSQKFKTKATIGNLNNHIGVPLTLLSFDETTEIGIVEMGANHQKEIEFLCGIAKPDYGYITNFGKAHLEGFGGVQGVIKGKSEMYDYLASNDKTAFVNLDDTIQVEKTLAMNKYTFGVGKSAAHVNITSVKANPFVEVLVDGLQIQSHLIGLYNANNINAAIAIGRYFNIDDAAIQAAIESYIPENNRSQLLTKGTNEIILDAYNANPSSMAVAIENFVQLDKPNKIMILGDMFELGTESLAEHQSIVDLLAQKATGKIYLVGKDFHASKVAKEGFSFFEDFEQLAQAVKNHTPKDALILIKGSRGMALERLLEEL
ncbi:UDP-N-acetylmuramoyl-tripeptide--D-alanyl-D-alanine ligase [Flavobacterium caeni]|uniref:UDP-N-acetylmuramoyl-tripeptide--D-alanyl-D-alanine ligase n=1 Tax=Flavobacterium caeni TaxID=490189 RepID=A0A1G5K0T0_9FLAO|nr:UDP-N-acetylmuramoyl-tripeptide--D-alanyl-D-alanine ligase [Flavobacterium caeni]SCY93469.1 UDP-N-acetylmuramoyl-tripeptide--D-alanyl-D-alanine ligase [Flavobacterium caeni]